MNELIALVKAHPGYASALLTAVGSWGFSAFVDALPDPAGSGKFYQFVYKFVHNIAGNLSRAHATKS